MEPDALKQRAQEEEVRLKVACLDVADPLNSSNVMEAKRKQVFKLLRPNEQHPSHLLGLF